MRLQTVGPALVGMGYALGDFAHGISPSGRREAALEEQKHQGLMRSAEASIRRGCTQGGNCEGILLPTAEEKQGVVIEDPHGPSAIILPAKPGLPGSPVPDELNHPAVADPQVNDQEMLLGPRKKERVYIHTDDTDETTYVGITDDLIRRAKQHKADPTKTGTKMIPISDPLTHGQARTIEAQKIRKILNEALRQGKITGRETIEEQLKKAGLDNKNRGRAEDRWVDFETDPTVRPKPEEAIDIKKQPSPGKTDDTEKP